MSEKQVTEPVATTAAAPKDDFKLASELFPQEKVTEKPASTEETQPTEIAAATEATEAEEAETEEVEEIEAGKAKKKGGFQRRIDKVTKQKEEALREKEYWRELALKGKSDAGDPKPDAKPAAQVDSSNRPKQDDFATHAEFTEALTDWKVDQKLAKEKASQREASLKSEQASKIKTHFDRVNEFKKDHADFDEVVEDMRNVGLSMTVNNSIIDSDFGPDLIYEFAKNPDELKRINSLSPESAARAIGRMEARFEKASSDSGKDSKAIPESKPVTKAPPPVKPLGSKAGSSKTSRDNLSYEDWANVRRQEMKASGR